MLFYVSSTPKGIWYLLYSKYQQFFVNKLLCRFISLEHHFKNVQVLNFINFVRKGTFNLKQWIQLMIKLQEHRKQTLSYVLVRIAPCSRPIKEDINFKFLNLGFNIKTNILWVFLSSYLVNKEMKELITPMTSFLMVFFLQKFPI